jgi:EAL domain-containing protein (putative c-di-GMP-specific phosphodiesterase class I)
MSVADTSPIKEAGPVTPKRHGSRTKACPAVSSGVDFEFSFAFQPIVDAETRNVISFEALVRGPHGESSDNVLSQLKDENRFGFDQACRLKAIHLASRLKLRGNLNINLFPYETYQTRMNIRATLQAALDCGFPADKIIFEVTESEQLTDHRRLIDIIRMYQLFGFRTALDDFGTGYSGLKLLVQYQPNYIKLDRNLIADIHENEVKQTIFHGINLICNKLKIRIMAEGVERAEEYDWLRRVGVNYFQGFYFAKPAFEALPEVAGELFAV